ncbi:MAG: CPBP family intramembrane glutamic endopeptidase, partial [bacterium]
MRVDPKGEVIGFQRKLPEDWEGHFLDTLAARDLSEAFLSRVWGLDMTGWDLVAQSSEDRPHRRDWTLEWERKGFRLKDAPVRLRVVIQGAEIGEATRYLRVPQEWWRIWERQRSQNELFQSLANVAAFLTVVAIFIVFFRNLKMERLPWRTALILGGVLAGVNIVMGLNSLPLTMASYETTGTYGAHFGKYLIGFILSGFFEGLLLLLLIGAGERLYRQEQPDKIYLPALFTRRGFLSSEMVSATVVGYFLAAFHIGFVVLFYLLGKEVGFWSPADVKYDNAVSTALPWIYPLAISMGAALLEEFWFRLWGVPFFSRLFKSQLVGLIVPALIWGFLHSGYPQQPGYARGIEVGLIGIVAGWVMLRFGIWATLTWHFVVDAIFIGLFLFRSSNPYFWISGLVVCGFLALPAVVAGVVYLRRGRITLPEDLTNRAVSEKLVSAAVPEEVEREKVPSEDRVSSLSPSAVRWAWIIGIGGLVLSLIPLPGRFGGELKPYYDKDAAIRKAKEEVALHYGIDPDTFRVGFTLLTKDIGKVSSSFIPYEYDKVSYALMNSYVKRYGDKGKAEEILFHPRVIGAPAWWVVFKSPGVAEEYGAVVPFKGGEVMVWHHLPDSARGADLGEEEALILAEAVFRRLEAHPDSYRVVERITSRRPNRRDWTFEWESLVPVIGEAHIRQVVRVKGDEVEVGERYLKVPEEWKRREEKETGWSQLRKSLVPLLVIALGVGALIQLGRGVKRRRVTWRTGLYLGGIVAVGSSVTYWCQFPTQWWVYSTSVSVDNFFTISLLGSTIGVILMGLITAAVVALGEALGREKGGGAPWAGWRGDKVRFRQGLGTALGGVGLLLGVSWLVELLSLRLHLPEHYYRIHRMGFLDGQYPLLMLCASVLVSAVVFVSIVWVLYRLTRDVVKSPWLMGLLFVVVIGAVDVWLHPREGFFTGGEEVWSLVKTGVIVGAIYGALRVWYDSALWAAMGAYGLALLLK